jgi:hypothetical protein
MVPHVYMNNPALISPHARTPSRKQNHVTRENGRGRVFSSSLPWGACLFFLIHAVMDPGSVFATETAVSPNAASAHSTELNVHPAPLPKVPITLNRQALGPNIRMWFPAYDGDGFFASLDQPKQLHAESLEAESVFQTSIQPILESLGFAADFQSHFYIPRHNGIPSGRANFSKLASRVCAGQHLATTPQPASPTMSSLPGAAEVHLVNGITTGSTGTVSLDSPSVSANNRLAFEQSQKEWTNWWCRVFEQVGAKEQIAILAKEEKPFLEALDRSFHEQTGQTFQQYVTEFEGEGYFYFFPQVHHPAQDEFTAGLTPPKAVTIDHAGIRADRREGQGIYSATGRVFVSYKIANKVSHSLANAAAGAATSLKTLNGITNAEDIPIERVSLVLLPSGEALADNKLIPALRYAYRMPAYVAIAGARKPVYVWLEIGRAHV